MTCDSNASALLACWRQSVFFYYYYLYMANTFFHQPFLSEKMAKADSSPRFPSVCSNNVTALLWLITQFTVIRLKPRGFCSPSACLAGPAPGAVNSNAKMTIWPCLKKAQSWRHFQWQVYWKGFPHGFPRDSVTDPMIAEGIKKKTVLVWRTVKN